MKADRYLTKKHFLIVAGWMLLCVFFFPVKTRAAAFVVKKGYEDQSLSEYETCLTVTSEDITSGKISFDSGRLPVFLGDRWQLCWMHSCSIQNLINASGFENYTLIREVNLDNKMTLTGDEINDSSDRAYNVEASAAMYYDEDGTLKIRDDAELYTYWVSQELALFYEPEEIPIGVHMDSYYDSGVIGPKWGEFYRRASTPSIVEACLERGLTLFYGQLDVFDINRPIEGIHVMYVTLKGDKPAAGEGSGGKDGKAASNSGAGKDSQTQSKTKKTVTKKTTTQTTSGAVKTSSKKKTKSTGTTASKKTTNESTNKTTKASSSNTTQYSSAGTSSATNPGAAAPAPTGQSAKADKGIEEEDNEEEKEDNGEEKKDDKTGVSGGAKELRTYTLKDPLKTDDSQSAMSAMDPDPKVFPLLLICMLAGAGFCILRFRSQLGQTVMLLPGRRRKEGRL